MSEHYKDAIEIIRFGRPKMDVIKNTKGGPFGWWEGQIPEESRCPHPSHSPPPLNPPLVPTIFSLLKKV